MPRRLFLPLFAALALFALVPAAASAHNWHPTKPQRAVIVAGGTTLALDPGAAAALQSLGVAAAPIAPATATSEGLRFPITIGLVNARTLAGQIRHSGGISLTAGSTRVELRRFRINIDANPDLTARVGDARVSILKLDLSQAQITRQGLRIKVANVGAMLTKAAADALNGAFGVSAFTEGLKLGTATVRAFALPLW